MLFPSSYSKEVLNSSACFEFFNSYLFKGGPVGASQTFWLKKNKKNRFGLYLVFERYLVRIPAKPNFLPFLNDVLPSFR